MKNGVRQRALELGFDACRVTTAAPPETAASFEAWLAGGRHGAMTYLARNAAKRVDPQQVLPGARSIITLAVSYAGAPSAPHEPRGDARESVAESASSRPAARPRAQSQSGDQARGIVARYARQADYHDVLARPLDSLVACIHSLTSPPPRSLAYVDTGPVLERDLAQRAGLGFIGKHTNLISRHLGNWFFLAEVLTTLELEPDPPEPNRCGTCTRCLDACPTHAIIAPFQLDARRCISYLTIELRGPIPVELRPALGARIFGCDDCLAVCPWNRFAQAGRLLRDHGRPDLAEPGLIELLALDEAGFKGRFAHTPLARAKRRGLLRNVCVALGNVGDAQAQPALARATHDPEPLIAEHAQWALAQIDARSRAREPR